MSAKEKEAAAKQTFTFLAPLTNEQSCEAGRKSAKRGFVSIGEIKSELWYNERKRKGSGCEADIYFSCAINERTAMQSRAG